MKDMFFIPFRQDNPEGKPKSLVANWEKMILTIEEALDGKQIQPILD
jgi:dipicolinate synthase subunit B